MAVLDTYSNRLKAEQRQNNDIYVYDEIPLELRVQIVYITQDLLKDNSNKNFHNYMVTVFKIESNYINNYLSRNESRLCNALLREWGKLYFDENGRNSVQTLYNYIISIRQSPTNHILDYTEVVFLIVKKSIQYVINYFYNQIVSLQNDIKEDESKINKINSSDMKISVNPVKFKERIKYSINKITAIQDIIDEFKNNLETNIKQATEELNERFRMAGVGYQIENQKVIQIDHQHIHKEIVKPALAIINNPVFEKVNEDYRAAHEHYRNQHVKDCITACNRAFEAMLKAICTEYQWSYDSNARASDLIKIVRKEGLFQDKMDKTFDSFIATLKTGVPELRNQLGGHGSDPQTESPPLYMASYLLHLTATNIIFLYEAFKAYKAERMK